LNDKQTSAKVKIINGVPRLLINDTPTAPIIFFGNTDIGHFVTEQVSMAALNGFHLHSCIYNLHFSEEKPVTCKSNAQETQDEISDLRRCLDAVIDGDPEAQLFLRVKVGAYFRKAPDEWKNQLIVYKNGSVYPEGSEICLVSTASDKWADAVEIKLKRIVEYIRNSDEYKHHVACIHLENCEWFEYGFRESGSDMSLAADNKFMEWQKRKYGAGYNSVPVPRDLPNNISSELYKNTLLLDKCEERFIDYFDYINDLVSGRIERFAKAIKDASDNQMMCIAFYGYLFELADCQSGHYNMRRLLDSPYLDGFAGPVSYGDRTKSSPGGAMGATSAYMTAMDTVARNGKIWFQESDQRTFVNNAPDSPWLPNIPSLEDIFNVHRREIGDIMLHGCGIWVMDLAAYGWLYDNAIWENLAKLKAEYEETIESGPSSFDAVFVIDEKAESIVGQPSFCGISGNLISAFRYEAYRAGISFAFAEITDVEAGLFDDARLYVFLNPYRLSPAQSASLAARIQREGKTSVFMYGFGMTFPADTSLLTGMDIRLTEPGTTVLYITKDGDENGFVPSNRGNEVTHRYTVSEYETLYGIYNDGRPAVASKNHGNYTTVFYGGTFISRENIRALCRIAGCHVYSEDGDVVVTDGKNLIYCATAAGIKNITLPGKSNVCSATDGKVYNNITSLSTDMKQGETKRLILSAMI
jgi:hypothetical protein